MLDTLSRGLFDTALTTAITPGAFVLCVGMSLLIGLLLCAMTLWRSNCTRSFAVTLAILPAVVCVVILMVNGNVGTGVAVAGAFNLVRFRSAQEKGLIDALRLRNGNLEISLCHQDTTAATL